MKPATLSFLRRLALESPPVREVCQRRTYINTARLCQSTPSARKAPHTPTYQPTIEESDLRKGVLKPLGRPIGFEDPPRPGDYSPEDDRTWRQRRDDFVNYEKHIERRKAMQKKFSKGYYKDWAMLRFNQGKTFLSNPKIFRADMALYFPNIVGKTLTSAEYADTTPILDGKISVVSVFTTQWADNQIRTFIGPKANPEVSRMINSSGGMAQHVYVNVEDNKMKWWVLWASQASIRNKIPEREWPNYFMVNYELPSPVRETLGLVNKTVGYVFLVDEECRIRWAGSGEARPEEKESLVKGLRRLLDRSSHIVERHEPHEEAPRGQEALA